MEHRPGLVRSHYPVHRTAEVFSQVLPWLTFFLEESGLRGVCFNLALPSVGGRPLVTEYAEEPKELRISLLVEMDFLVFHQVWRQKFLSVDGVTPGESLPFERNSWKEKLPNPRLVPSYKHFLR